MRLPPLDLDPPDHAAYRVLLNPFFAPRVVAELEAKARALTVQLIDDLKPKGGCDFVADFARVLPVTVFLDMMDLPLSLRTQFIGWAEAVLQASTAEAKLAAFKAIVGYLGGVIAEREDARGDDLVSRLLDARDAGKMPHPDDALGVVTLLFLGGIDTVANMLAFTAGFLAGSPAHRRRLVEDPEVVPRAVEEFIRRFGLSNTIRTLTVDYEYKGVRFREGEAVMVPISMSSMDDRIYDRPLEIDFNRDNPRGHDTFGNGPHRCVGMHLARAEMRIFLQEWVKRIPDFEIPPGASAPSISASVNAVKALPLAWPVE
jgi:cytochrome P450